LDFGRTRVTSLTLELSDDFRLLDIENRHCLLTLKEKN
jgi:hypothetical protein